MVNPFILPLKELHHYFLSWEFIIPFLIVSVSISILSAWYDLYYGLGSKCKFVFKHEQDNR